MTQGEAFLINNKTMAEIGIPNPNKNLKWSLNIVTSEIVKSIIGTVEELDIVNNVPKVTVTWQVLTQTEINTLFAELGINFPNAGILYTGTGLEDNIVLITAMFPFGERSFNAYVGQTINFEQDYNENQNSYIYRNLQLSFIGIGG